MLFSFSAFASVDSCSSELRVVKDKLEKIKIDLEFIVAKNQYQENVQNRYDMVKSLMYLATACINNVAISKELVIEWQQIEKVVVALHTNAQTCAFTKFDKWMVFKESDLNIFKENVVGVQDPGSLK